MAKPSPTLFEGQLELVRPPAPGKLELVRSFLNTRDLDKDVDAIATPSGLLDWLREQGLIDAKSSLRATVADVERVRLLREDLRAMTRRNNGARCDCRTERLEKASARSAFRMIFDPAVNTAVLSPSAKGIDGAVGRILAAVHVAMAAHTWPRLKTCADDSCSWTYYDHSKNGISRWCTTEICGNRSKVKRYRERQAKAAT